MLAWEAAWLPKPVAGVADQKQAMTIDIAALGHAVHGAIRPAALLAVEAQAEDPFVTALRRIEVGKSRIIQAQNLFLQSDDLKTGSQAVNSAGRKRLLHGRALWSELDAGI